MNIRPIRALAIVVGPSLALDLFVGASVAATAVGALRRLQKGAARQLRPLVALGALAPWLYLLLIRSWHLRWGATEEEVRRILPGDELIPQPLSESTRAITINTPAEAIWPWLVQLGQGCGGSTPQQTAAAGTLWVKLQVRLDLRTGQLAGPQLQDGRTSDHDAALPPVLPAGSLRCEWGRSTMRLLPDGPPRYAPCP